MRDTALRSPGPVPRGLPLRRLLRELLELALPPACAGCAGAVAAGAALCAGCDARLPRLVPARDPLPTPPLAALFAAVSYAGEAEAWIRRFKYPPRGLAGLDPGPAAVARSLAREAARAITAAGLLPAPTRVVPVPLHPRRLRERGFNPAAALAREAARALGARFDAGALLRRRDTPSQTGLDRAARRRNVAGAFEAARPLAGDDVLLVDDVATTGATLAEAARTLRRAGAGRITALCAARTP